MNSYICYVKLTWHTTVVSKKSDYSVKRDLLQCQKRPTTVSEETYWWGERDLLLGANETCKNFFNRLDSALEEIQTQLFKFGTRQRLREVLAVKEGLYFDTLLVAGWQGPLSTLNLNIYVDIYIHICMCTLNLYYIYKNTSICMHAQPRGAASGLPSCP